MYKTRVSLYNTDETINRRIVIKAIENTIKYLGLSRDIYYTFDEHEFIDREKNKLGKMESYSSPRSEHIKVDFETDISPDYDVSLRMLRPNTYPIYQDNDVNVKAIPVNVNTRFTISFEYLNKSKSKVSNLINKLKTLPANGGQYMVNHFDYFYVMPYYLFMLVKNVNEIKNEVNSTDIDIDIETYINTYFDLRVDTINPIDGDSLKTDVVLREVQKNVISKITTNLAELKKEEVEDETAWSIKFDYEFDIELPTEVIIQYPITIYNKLIDERFRTFIKNDEFDFKGDDLLGEGGLRDIGIRKEFNMLINNKEKPYLNIPSIDTIDLPPAKPYMMRLVSIMTLVDSNDPNVVFNINDIPIIKFNQVVLDHWVESEYPYIGDYYKSLFYFELYRGNELNDANKIIMDSNLNLRTTIPMDPRYTYRLTINVLLDLNILRRNDLERLMLYVESKDEDIDILDYYKELITIPQEELIYHKKDLVIDPKITNNLWESMKTKQLHAVYTAVMEPK